MTSTKPYITITHGMRGYFAVMYWWNPDLGGFWEPYQSSPLSFKNPADACADGRVWAEAEGLGFRQ